MTARPAPPPGPRLPGIAQIAAYLQGPPGFLRRCQRRYGDVFRLSPPGTPNIAFVADPELARRVFATDRDIGRAGEPRRDLLEPLVGRNSLLCMDGEDWTRQRKMLGSAFHGKRVEAYRDEIGRVAAEAVRHWPVGQLFALRPRMRTIALEVILRVVFGIGDTARLDRLRELLPRLTAAAESPVALSMLLTPEVWRRAERSRLLAKVPGDPFARFASLRTRVDRELYAEIARRREAPDLAERTDVLSVLLRARDESGYPLTDVELRDALITLLEAGHETTATGLSWVFERLVRHPEALDQLTRAVDHGDRRYPEAVSKESLRVRPVLADMPRALTAPLDLGDYRIPPGWWVAPSAPLLHGSAAAFPGPDLFRPDRFLSDEPPPQAWTPFGGGRRQCLAAHFALLEMQAVIAEVVKHLELRPPEHTDGEGVRQRGVTLTPSQDGRVVARTRRPVPD